MFIIDLLTVTVLISPLNSLCRSISINFSLGMNVDRWALYELIDGYKNFRAIYNNTTDHHVKIEVPYNADKSETRKN